MSYTQTSNLLTSEGFILLWQVSKLWTWFTRKRVVVPYGLFPWHVSSVLSVINDAGLENGSNAVTTKLGKYIRTNQYLVALSATAGEATRPRNELIKQAPVVITCHTNSQVDANTHSIVYVTTCFETANHAPTRQSVQILTDLGKYSKQLVLATPGGATDWIQICVVLWHSHGGVCGSEWVGAH